MRKVQAVDFQIFLIRAGLKQFLSGFYYFKWLEYPLAYNHLELNREEQYLDIGSGKSIFPFFVLSHTQSIVNIIDNQSIIKDSLQYYKDTAKKMGWEGILGKRLFIHEARGEEEFNFPDGYFDKISCISTIEHLKDNGDSRMMKTIERILKKGGRTVVTFPFSNGEYIEEENASGVGYFQRKYNISQIKRRLIDPVNLKVTKVIYFGERFPSFGGLYLKNKLVKINWLLPLFSPFFWRVCYSYQNGFRDFHEKAIDKKGIGVASIIFEK